MMAVPCAEERRLRLEAEAKVARLEGREAALAAALRRVTQLIDYREHAFGQPEVEDGAYLKSLHDTLPQSHAALSDTGGGWVPPEVREQVRAAWAERDAAIERGVQLLQYSRNQEISLGNFAQKLYDTEQRVKAVERRLRIQLDAHTMLND